MLKHDIKKAEQGFTLIELSIVLVIIGLIVGGVLVGQDLIKAAEIRATISQIEKYNTAVNTFRNKYNGIPGDLTAATATSFGIANSIAFTGATGIGDGNGLIEGGSSGANTFLGEPPMFWLELSASSLMDGSYLTALTTGGAIPTAVSSTLPASTYMPLAKLGRGNYITVGSANGINYYAIAGVTAVTTGGAYTSTNNLTAQEAYKIDGKVDDGLPTTGSVQALDTATTALSAASLAGFTTNAVNATAPNCVTATPTYNVNPGTAQACSLRLRFN